MSVSRLLPSGGANDFNLNIGATYTSVTLNKEYASGAYSIVSGNNDTTLDIYAYNADGSIAGYTNTKSFNATKGFNKIVVLGGQAGDVLGFTYKTTYTTINASDETTAGPVIASISPTDLPNIDSSATISGRNFNAAMTVKFTGTDAVVRNAKSVTIGSATSAIVVRPDTFPTTASPYTVTISNSAAGISDPTGSNSHILSNAVTAGNAPVWSTSATLPVYQKSYAYSTTLVATDSSDAGSTLTYSIVTGTLPTGLSMTSGGVISGTPTVTSTSTFTVRATDSGGNFVDRAFTLAESSPVWSSPAAGALSNGSINTAYTSVTFIAYDTNGASTSTAGITYSVSAGSIPAGMTLNSSTGIFSGTPTTASEFSFTVRATDSGGLTADRSFTLSVGLGSTNNISVASGGTHTDIGATATYGYGAGAAGTAISRDSVLMCGGTNGTGSSSPSNVTYIYNNTSNTWTQKANMPAVRSGHGIGVVGGTVYVWGGNSGNMSTNYWGGGVETHTTAINHTPNNTTYAYSISGNTWTTKATMPVSTMQANGASSGTKLYAFGADTASANAANASGTRDIYVYDTVADTWSTLTNKFDTNDFSCGSTCWATSNKTGIIYGYGGHFATATNTAPSAKSWWFSFDPSTNTLTKFSTGGQAGWPSTNSHTPTAWFPGNGNDGYVFVMGGQAGSDNYTRYYDISANSWSPTGPNADGSISYMINSNFYASNNYNMALYMPNGTPVGIFFGGYGNSTERWTPATGTGTYSIKATTFNS